MKMPGLQVREAQREAEGSLSSKAIEFLRKRGAAKLAAAASPAPNAASGTTPQQPAATQQTMQPSARRRGSATLQGLWRGDSQAQMPGACLTFSTLATRNHASTYQRTV